MNTRHLGFFMLGVNGRCLVGLITDGPQFWIQLAAIISSCIAWWLVITTFPSQANTDVNGNRERKSEKEQRREDNKRKLKALMEGYNRLDNSVNVQQEQYALEEACFQASEAYEAYVQDPSQIRREKSNRAAARSAELRLERTRRELRLKRLWLDVGNLKREMGSWDAWWYAS